MKLIRGIFSLQRKITIQLRRFRTTTCKYSALNNPLDPISEELEQFNKLINKLVNGLNNNDRINLQANLTNQVDPETNTKGIVQTTHDEIKREGI